MDDETEVEYSGCMLPKTIWGGVLVEKTLYAKQQAVIKAAIAWWKQRKSSPDDWIGYDDEQILLDNIAALVAAGG